jgi:anti-anti-sigma factor
VIALSGEHDLSTSEALRVALASVTGKVLVDLTACSFLDPTIIGVILRCDQRLAGTGSRLELLLPAEANEVARVLEVVHVRDLVRTREAAELGDGPR